MVSRHFVANLKVPQVHYTLCIQGTVTIHGSKSRRGISGYARCSVWSHRRSESSDRRSQRLSRIADLGCPPHFVPTTPCVGFGLQIDDKFDKLELIGEGTYGMVYKATRKG